MDAVNARDSGLLQMRRHRFVGRQHELLDDAVREITGRANHSGHLPKLVELDQRLRHVEID